MATPLQLHHSKLKTENPSAVLFFQLGDFYELFGDDAVLGARVLGIALTARHKGSDNEMKMCGFPKKAAAQYIKKLADNGYPVAIADQTEDENGQITRRVTRVITPGVNLEASDGGDSPRYLAAMTNQKQIWALAYAEITTGEFKTAVFSSLESFLTEVYRLNIQEMLIPTNLYEEGELTEKLAPLHLTPRSAVPPVTASESLKKQYGVADLQSFGFEHLQLGVVVSGMVLLYLQETQKAKLRHLQEPKAYRADQTLQLDAETMSHLELFTPLYSGGSTQDTLWGVLAKPITPSGKRQLHRWLVRPLLDQEKIQKRQTLTKNLAQSADLAEKIRETLKTMYDTDRLMARIATSRATPQDLGRFRVCLTGFLQIADLLMGFACPQLQGLIGNTNEIAKLEALLAKNMSENPPTEMQNGGIIARGANSELDALLEKADSADRYLQTLLEKWKKELGIANLRVKYAKSFGYSLEVSNGNIDKVPDNWHRRQTLVNAQRYRNAEIETFETEVLGASEKANQWQYEMFVSLREACAEKAKIVLVASQRISFLDVLLSFWVSHREKSWQFPTFNNGNRLMIKKAAHPVVQAQIGAKFIVNDLEMERESSRFQVITGPNMAGKSTYLRQNAIIIILAQIGSPVPATVADLPIIDRVFTRVGASDNLGGGKSTFYIEMNETARILRSATNRSFIVLDEIGRGTSTYDGLSLAWAIMKDIIGRVGAWGLFATHYHELVKVTNEISGAENRHVAVNQSQQGLEFLHRILPGGASDSFGIEVANLAGVPPHVVHEAQKILQKLENQDRTDVPLFDLAQKPCDLPTADHKKLQQQADQLQSALQAIDLDQITPLQALNQLDGLKKLAEELAEQVKKD